MVPAALSAEDLYARALTATNAGRFPAARRLLDRARNVAVDPDLRARVDLTTAYVESETESPARGLELALAVLDRPHLRPETYGRTWSQLGLLHMRTGRGEEALSAFAEAVPRLDEHPEPQARVLLNRGNVYLQQGDTTRAATDFTDAAARFGEAGISVEQAKSRFNLGYVELLRGDLVAALRGMDDARDVLAPLSPAYRATVEQDRAEVLMAAGMSREAARALEAAAAAYGARRLRRFQAECELTLAQTLLRGDPSRARVVARRAARRFRAQDTELPALRADGLAVIAEVALGGRSPALLRRIDALADALLALDDARDALPLRLQAARLATTRGDLDDATERVRRIRVRDRDPLAVRLHWREVQAELAEARHRPSVARRHVRAGLTDLHAWQSSFGSLDLQSTLVGHGRDLARLGLRSALADGRPDLVLEWSERARALVGRVAPVRPPRDPQLAADLTELRMLQAGQPAPRSAEARRRDELAASIRQRSWYGEGGGRVGEPAGLAELRDELTTTDAALVAHLVVDGRLAALVVTPERAEVHPLAPVDEARRLLDAVAADLDMAASDLAGPFAAAIRGSLEERLVRVAELLVGPVLPALDDRRLVLTPSGVLAGTPWSLLDGLRGRPLTIPTSATRWLALRRTPPAGGGRVGLVAGPHVPRGEEEVSRASKEWPGAQVLRGAEATAPRVSALAAEVDVLHLAGHGRHPGDNPMFSAVELVDGPWFGYDIDQLAATPSVVVLSACELGRVAVRSGEEAVGMSAAWLHAGARTVVSSPALVADDVACEVLAGWHQRVSRGEGPADALAAASVAVSAGGRAAAPSPFLCFGTGW
jgi:tetratricopeptide (TPR) repeat protein